MSRNLVPSGGGAEALRDRSLELERRLERLGLLCQALGSLRKNRLNFSEEDLERRVRELDLLDGREDGRLARGVECAACRRTFSRRRKLCLYRGAPRSEGSPFDAV